MRTILLFALAACALAGCSNKPKDTAAEKIKPGESEPMAEEERIKEALEKGTERPEGHYDIEKPGTKWDDASAPMLTVGALMDERARETRNSLCRAVFTYDDPRDGKLTGKPEVRIQDKDHFEVEFMLPETKHAYNRIKGDGQRTAQLQESGWTLITKSSTPKRVLTEKEVAEWPRRFPVEMFSYLTEGVDAWGPLFEAWSKGVGGYTAVFEEQTFKQGDSEAAHYRVYAETKKDGGTTIEVIIDKEALRPLTVKVNGTMKDGREYDMYWTGSWFAGGKYDEGAFDLPPTVARSAKAS
jgi:hypothetical protein